MSRPACRGCAWRHNQPSMCRRRTVTDFLAQSPYLCPYDSWRRTQIKFKCLILWWAVLGSNQWPLPCETEVGCLRINDMRAAPPIATRTCCHLISLDITQCHDRTVPKLSQRPLSTSSTDIRATPKRSFTIGGSGQRIGRRRSWPILLVAPCRLPRGTFLACTYRYSRLFRGRISPRESRPGGILHAIREADF
jgi:hypothetical protein